MAKPKTCCRTSRSDLISLLSQACEFEHGLACAYLYTSFTLKQEIREGIDWREQQLAHRWAAAIFDVAAEEMLHLAQVWNLLAAIGGNPFYWRPNFPVRSNYYPAPLPIELLPFGEESLDRFIQYEMPFEDERLAVCKQHNIQKPAQGAPPYGSVGELYTVVREIVAGFPEDELFIGVKQRQVDDELVDFPNLIKVVDRETALAAIDLIKEQGEGAEMADDEDDQFEQIDVDRDGHYRVFIRVRAEYLAERDRAQASGKPLRVVRDVISNPVAKFRTNYGVQIANEPQSDDNQQYGYLIQDEYTSRVAVLFDQVYLLMLRLLQYVFRNSTDDKVVLRAFARTAIGLMPTLIKPLAEALTLLRAGDPYGDMTAGPAFGLSRHVTLPEHPQTAITIVRERLDELIAKAEKLAADQRAPAQLVNANRNLAEWRDRLGSMLPDF